MSAGAAEVRRVEGAGVELAVFEHGEGTPVLFIHGLAYDHAIWNETLAQLPDGLRAITYDRRGYGASGAPEPYEGTTIEEQAEDAAAVLTALEATPAVICASSFGAVVGLDLMKRRAELVRAALLLEPPLLSLSPAGAEFVSRLVENVREGRAAEGEPGVAAAVVRTVCGPTADELAGPERTERMLTRGRSVAIDSPAPAKWEFTRGELRAIDTPTTVFCGTRSPEPFHDAARELAGMLGAATLREFDSTHMLPLEQPRAVAEEVATLAGR